MIASTRIPASEMWPLHLGGQVLESVGTACARRPLGQVPRRPLFAAAGVTYFLELTGESPRPATELLGVSLLSTMPIAFGYFWTTFESLGYYRRLRLRVRLGLTEVVVANRVLLWGLMTLAAGVAVIINLAQLLAGSLLSTPTVLVSSCLGIVLACCAGSRSAASRNPPGARERDPSMGAVEDPLSSARSTADSPRPSPWGASAFP